MTYGFSERLGWYIRMTLIALCIIAGIAVVAATWYQFYTLVSMAERALLVPRTND